MDRLFSRTVLGREGEREGGRVRGRGGYVGARERGIKGGREAYLRIFLPS